MTVSSCSLQLWQLNTNTLLHYASANLPIFCPCVQQRLLDLKEHIIAPYFSARAGFLCVRAELCRHTSRGTFSAPFVRVSFESYEVVEFWKSVLEKKGGRGIIDSLFI